MFVTFTSFFFRRLFWKRETIPGVIHELSNLIIINSDYTVMTEQKVSIGLSLHERTKAIEMLQWFADILIDILIALKSSWPSRSSFSWSIVFIQHIVDSSDLLTWNKHDNNTCFLVLPISIFSLLRTRPSTTWKKCIQLSIYYQEKRRGYTEIFTIIR